MSCSSKRNTAAGSCISTLVSSTNARRAPLTGRFFSIGSGFSRGFEHLGRVPLDPHLAPLAAQRARGIDQEGAALDAHHLAAVHVLLLPDAELRGDRVVLVGPELEGELHLILELTVRLQRVG